MSVVAVGSVRSCGATTLALGLVATSPDGRRALLAELDPAGGTLAAAAGWAPEPSLVSLAAAARRGGDPELVFEHCQSLPGGAAALAAPASADQARAALGMLGALIGRMGELDAGVVFDCGRLDPGSPALAVLERADRVLVAVRPRLADLHAVATWLGGHPFAHGSLRLVAIGDGPYKDEEIADALCVPVAARLPWDPEAAQALALVPASSRQLRMVPLVRAARTLADRLAGDVAQEPGVEVAGASVGTSARTARRALGALRTRPAVASANGSSPEGASS